jgi:L-asparaginase
MKQKVLILYTGGTIGMKPTNSGYEPCPEFGQILNEKLRLLLTEDMPDYQIIEMDDLIDSANASPDDWSTIAHKLVDNWQEFDGFVVLHGTDTMTYTASALSFMLQGLDKPVIFTGSQIPLLETRNDATNNLLISLKLATNRTLREVCLYFNGRLMRANRASKLISNKLDAFDTPNLSKLGHVGIDIEINTDLLLKPSQPNFCIPNFNSDAVSVIPIYPGISAKIVDSVLKEEALQGLILLTYGVGNIPDKNTALMDVLEQGVLNNKVIVNISQCMQGGVSQGAYATGNSLNTIGVVSGADLSLEAAFTKLHYLFAKGFSIEEIKTKIAKPISGECQA